MCGGSEEAFCFVSLGLGETFDYVVPPLDLWAGLFLMFRQLALVLIPLDGQTEMEGR